MEYLIDQMPVEKPSINIEDEYDRKLSESVRIRIMIENSIFKTKFSNEFSYGSEEGVSPSAGAQSKNKASPKTGDVSPNITNSKMSGSSSNNKWKIFGF